jgi:DNA-directed RNA polymerase specialized sigma24 family protein
VGLAHCEERRDRRVACADPRAARVRDALRRLGPEKAQVVYFNDVLGHEIDEIASTLGISVAATQSRLVRGRKEIGAIVATLERKKS